jgi:hypothetical protein
MNVAQPSSCGGGYGQTIETLEHIGAVLLGILLFSGPADKRHSFVTDLAARLGLRHTLRATTGDMDCEWTLDGKAQPF